jgi:hypothetical protein
VRHFLWLLVVTALASVGCKLPGGVACSADARPAVSVDVRDSVTDTPAGRGARIIAQDGVFADTAKTPSGYEGPYALARERAGTYTVTVEQEGYQLWSRSGVRVTRDECHVRTVSLIARLQR